MLSDKDIIAATKRCYDAWETGNAAAIVDSYTDDVVYSDMKAVGRIIGGENLRRYITRFVQRYDIKFRVTEEHRLKDVDGLATIWEAAIRPRDAEGRIMTQLVMTRGFDIVMVRGDKVSRDEAYWDHTAIERLANLVASP